MTNLRNYVFQNLALPSRILSSSKIAKVERNSKFEKLRFSEFGIAEPPPIFFKDGKSRAQWQNKEPPFFKFWYIQSASCLMKIYRKAIAPTNHINLVPSNLSLPTSILYNPNNIIKFVQQQSSKPLFFLSSPPLSLIPIDWLCFRTLINAILFFPNVPNMPHFQIITTFRFSVSVSHYTPKNKRVFASRLSIDRKYANFECLV